MFHLYKYSLLGILRNRDALFWTMLFPVLLGTLFFVAFGNIIERTENFSQIPVAAVITEESERAGRFADTLEELSAGEDAMLSVSYFLGMTEAENALKDGDVEGIFSADEGLELIIAQEGINQDILKNISDSFLQIYNTVSGIAAQNPAKAAEALEILTSEAEFVRAAKLARGETDTFINYYYALIAMSCLFGSLFGHFKALENRSDLSSRAARRGVCPRKKISLVICDFAAALTVHFAETLLVIAYLAFILGINFGTRWGFVILTSFVGCITGIGFGMFFTSVTNKKVRLTENLLMYISLFMCFLSGLMVGDMKNIIEKNVPVINRINPAALLTDAFYCLTVYDGYSRYARNIISLLVISALFCAVSALVLRRKQYDHV